LMLRHVVRLPAAVEEETYSSALRVLGDMLPHGFDPHVPRWALQAAIMPAPAARGRYSSPLQRKRRDEEARRLAGSGWKRSAIARRMGVDRRTVDRILTVS
jgi:hypothetical protein